MCTRSCVAAGDVLRGDDHAAGRIRHAHGLPAEQLQGAAGPVHGSGVLFVHGRGGGPHTRYVFDLSFMCLPAGEFVTFLLDP